MPTRFIEFHDGEVSGHRSAGRELVLEARLYVHESDGMPGVDPGIGWYQQAAIVLASGELESSPSAWPLRVADGVLMLGPERFENGLPLPFDRHGPVLLELEGQTGDRLVCRANGLRVELVGDPGEPESFE